MNARLEELRSKFHENPRRYFAPYANELRKAGDVAQAISVCRTHMAAQPGHVSGHIVLGQALYEAGEALDARETFTAALELDPENLIALRSLGEIAQVRGEFGVARQWYERLLDADPRNNDVVQLLKDLPPVSKAAQHIESAEAHAAEITLAEHAVDTPPPPVPTFHTNFTGAVPAYEPREPEVPATHEASTDFVDIEGSQHEESTIESEHVHVPVGASAETDTHEPLDVVDLDAFGTPTSSATSTYDAAPPDESYSAGDSHEANLVDDMGFEMPPVEARAPTTERSSEAETPIEIEAHESGELTSASATDEQPRAIFAERGFDGPAGDQIGWMTTPSARESDLEAAPEDWFDEPAAPVVEDTYATSAESSAEEQHVAEVSDHATVEWFDEPAKTLEVESSADRFWLPPDLSQVEADEMPAAPEFAEPFSEQAAYAEAAPPAMAEDSWDRVEPDRIDVEAISAPPAEAIAEDHHVEASTEAYHAEAASAPVHVEAPADDYPIDVTSPDRLVEAVADESNVEAATSVDESSDEREDAESVALPTAESYPEPVIGHTPTFDQADSPVTRAPFVTETLAELYLQQGFRDEALAIYRELAARDPSDQSLRLRVEAVERGSDTIAPAAAPTESQTSSQSVRTFFGRFARRAAVTAPENPAQPAESAANPEVPFASAASALANLFAASKPPASDEGAASTLANAFTDPAGRPSRAAERELSLDHLFRDVPPGGSPRGGVSLDEFYSTPNASAGSPTEPGEAGESAESGGTDIRQFTAWLEGLRKK